MDSSGPWWWNDPNCSVLFETWCVASTSFWIHDEESIFSPSRSHVCLWRRRVVEWLRSGGIRCSDVAFTTLVLYHPAWWSISFLSLCFSSVYLICRSSGSRRIGGKWFLLCFCWAVVLIGASSEIVISDICWFPTIESINIQNLFFVCGVLRLL